MDATVLIVDDEKNTREGLRQSFEDDFDVYVASDRAEALEVLRLEQVDVMVTDLRLGADDGMKLIDEALRMAHPPVVIMMTAFGGVDTAVEAMRRGAWHFVTKPLNVSELEMLIRRAARSKTLEKENTALKKQVDEKYGLDRLIGHSPPMQRVYDTVTTVAPTRATILIQGESGTGKELVAAAIHRLSGRPQSKLITVNCAALSSQLLESELFGHEKGSFTGATGQRIGRFESAHGGTLFLDEIGEIDASTQVKLLRALGERTIERVGGNTTVKVDVRVIAATNKNLAAMVEAGTFREDLYFRLNVVTIHMPPLRERRGDIPVMAATFLRELAKENRRDARDFTPPAMDALLAHTWPGNVRELRTAIEHAVVMCPGPKIEISYLPASVLGAPLRLPQQPGLGAAPAPAPASPALPAPALADLNLENMEHHMIRLALQRSHGRRAAAAALLGISRRTLTRKLAILGLPADPEDTKDP